MHPSTNISKKSGVVSSSIWETFFTNSSIRDLRMVDLSIYVAPSKEELPIFSILEDGKLDIKPIDLAFSEFT